MAEIVIRDRTIPRLIALLPAVVVVLAVRLLTLGRPPIALRAAVAGLIAMAAWTAYRLLTARVTVTASGVLVRGVLYDADVAWAELDAVAIAPARGVMRMLLWGLVDAHAVSLHGRSHTVRPIAMIAGPDDASIEQAVNAMRARAAVALVRV